ncbi:hypothetical protein Val02_52870 [Virgisporangium aliadipatigenens]|uniref:Antitoxin SocA-like Panacea domain-containing protein n=1 Tax=Virgisporangium aliadipatigenens TaxID=741659 RepID=A0A8J4DSQ2_9ACTN|nr:type II toxin-antitoxin system antitoxin SocA domain-containing protein [Virgisporangium aliadipatigenens]GIJ48401.1 hypothetical protein Val02_52870 [Virgisporangium aliadipatigenens]
MSNVHDVAAAVLQRLGPMTAMKLEKLVYYCQCWHLAHHRTRLFPETIEAWRQGPVVPELYRRHRGQYSISTWPQGSQETLAADEVATVDWVVARYGDFTPVELSRMTHNELPWRAARGALPDSAGSDEPIRTDIIEMFYSRQVADVETAVAHAVSNAALEGADFDADWQERLRDVASGEKSADELVAEEIARFKS